ncbi:30S ribosomal protein S9 [Candidatus Giovannonibacteria bacterium RIFCSPLOWO2_12_FULL_44_25]|uniref:Small ribosomal subunit protein uS9 n=2 Tax=Candidatus Giovannoniibacteriota TaxID=1752738 RepID=A0A1F5W7P4_9BACT|nr:MAG: 30S ribosomal protein S9 [Parcubacteria group bacterium GW2011_GWC1_44_10]KKT60007.1 MAG: 30S ribosomal protein S9 [Candidatus Giovannonibacteria bacterium GW2011_GWA1_44_25]KKU30125.1 MAG: 30S ribosomal protein S9 [Candidatus Giovannonibacteria bacterium GW2011_GWB1_46_20]OGF49707.1 MAG: 30S ribosomal protein S9 [Candidatus Giovannonibacteria bacterium GWA2_45_15]OGF59168.1 MAG: 30S ribosomal protein S9 [Candidatus Giovannonibacteria bacterium RIFCSPHIGHO2_01_45_12]OGF61211.1 MAG: 30S
MAKTNKEKPAQPPARYFEAVGRRKTSVARVRLFSAKGGKEKEPIDINVNNRPHTSYFPTPTLKKIAEEALRAAHADGSYRVSAKISGGGIHSQAEAMRHGISRALLKIDSENRKILKPLGFLKRDPRMKERRKFGLKKARKAPQWAKR